MTMLKNIATYLFFFSLLLSSFFPFSTTHAAENQKKLTLVGEIYENATLTREYRDQNNQEVVRTFIVPEQLREEVNQAKNPLLEAKKQLTAYYTISNNEAFLQELNNISLLDEKAELTLSKNLKESFVVDVSQSTSFAEEQAKLPHAKDKYKAKEPVSQNPFEEPNGEKVTEKEEVSNQSDQETLSDNSSFFFYGGIAFLFIIIGSLIFIVLKRR